MTNVYSANRKNSAFTLSEVLITLGVIGVVAALTVPNLVKNYQQEAQITQLRKVVNDIQSAVDMIMTEENKSDFTKTSVFKDTNGIDTFIKTYFKVSKTCSGKTDCFAEKYSNISKSKSEALSTCPDNSYVYILANSASLCVIPTNLYIHVDINGLGKPNIAGRDKFFLAVDSNGNVIDQRDHGSNLNYVSYCQNNTDGRGCFEVLQKEVNWNLKEYNKKLQ